VESHASTVSLLVLSLSESASPESITNVLKTKTEKYLSVKSSHLKTKENKNVLTFHRKCISFFFLFVSSQLWHLWFLFMLQCFLFTDVLQFVKFFFNCLEILLQWACRNKEFAVNLSAFMTILCCTGKTAQKVKFWIFSVLLMCLIYRQIWVFCVILAWTHVTYSLQPDCFSLWQLHA